MKFLSPACLLFLSALTLPSPASGRGDGGEEVPGVAVSTPTKSAVQEAVEKVGETLERGVETVQKGAAAVSEGAKALGEGAKTVGQETAKQAQALTRSLRRIAIEIGTGIDEGRKDVVDPFIPKGLDRLFDWDMRLLVRNDGMTLRANYLNPPRFKKLSMDYRLRFDPFDRAGLGDQRDNLYDGLGLTPPAEKRGYGIGASAVKSAHWGYNAGYDRVRSRDGADRTMDQVTSLGVGYSPLGENDGKVWNYSLVGSVNWEDLRQTVAGVHSSAHGPGFSLGPVYQYGLDWVPIPWARRLGLEDKVKLNRFKARLAYSDSQIHPSAFGLGVDVSGYATKALRLTLGADYQWLPLSGEGKFKVSFGLSIIIDFLDIKF